MTLNGATRFYDTTLASLGLQRCATNDPDWDRMVVDYIDDETGFS
jgi:hypothetical protein